MQKWFRLILFVGLATALAAIGMQKARAAQEQTPEYVNLLNTKCITCHTNDRWEKKDFTAEQWEEILQRMRAKGAQITEEEMKILLHWADPK